ncbi:hypothetical protein JXA80_14740 [bacterium]|nr:hypothetical protein [candidate division CSSED10-310 bacterium]
MIEKEALFSAIDRVARDGMGDEPSPCPGWDLPASFPDGASQELIRHVAFCPMCRMRLHLRHTGMAASVIAESPDWSKMVRRLARYARWSTITAAIRHPAESLTEIMAKGFPGQVAMAWESPGTRRAQPGFPGLSLTIFEVNLTAMEQLSSQGLTAGVVPASEHPGGRAIRISGFHPALSGAEARLGLASRSAFLSACDLRPDSETWNLIKIEQRLQRGFQRSGALSRRMSRLIADTVWLEGVLAAPNAPVIELCIDVPDPLSGWVYRGDVWMILIVSTHAMNPERAPETRI